VTLREALQGIYEKHGALTPHLVVTTFRPKTHPCHGSLNWDDKAAAEAHRLDQARALIRSVTIVYVEEEDDDRRIRAWQTVRDDNGQRFEPIQKIAEDEFLAELVLRDMEREWKQLRDRYDRFAEFRELVQKDIA
jgi:hypothetical protein